MAKWYPPGRGIVQLRSRAFLAFPIVFLAIGYMEKQKQKPMFVGTQPYGGGDSVSSFEIYDLFTSSSDLFYRRV